MKGEQGPSSLARDLLLCVVDYQIVAVCAGVTRVQYGGGL